MRRELRDQLKKGPFREIEKCLPRRSLSRGMKLLDLAFVLSVAGATVVDLAEVLSALPEVPSFILERVHS